MGTIGVIDALTGGFTILKNNIYAAWPLALFTIVVTVLTLTITTALLAGLNPALVGLQMLSIGHTNLWVGIGSLITVIVAAFLIQPLITGMYLSGANSLVGGNAKTINLRKAYREARSRYLSLLGSTVLYQIIFFAAESIPLAILLIGLTGLFSAIAVPASGIAYGASLLNGAKLLILGAALLILVAIILSPFLFFALPAVIIEKKRAVESIRRSFQIGRNSFWRILGLLLLIGLIGVAIYIVASIIAAVFSLAGPLASVAAQTIIHIIIGIFLSLLSAFASVMAYKAYLGTRKAPSTNK